MNLSKAGSMKASEKAKQADWNWPPKNHTFKKFDDKLTAPRLTDLAAIKLKPE